MAFTLAQRLTDCNSLRAEVPEQQQDHPVQEGQGREVCAVPDQRRPDEARDGVRGLRALDGPAPDGALREPGRLPPRGQEGPARRQRHRLLSPRPR